MSAAPWSTEIVERLKQRGRADPRHHASISSRCRTSRSAPASSRAQYQYTLIGTDAGRGAANGRNGWPTVCAVGPVLRDVASEAQEGGLAHHGAGRPRDGGPARRLDAGGQRHAQQRLRPAPDLDHLRAGQPVSRDPGGDAALSAGPGGAVQALSSPGDRRRSGAAQHAGALRADHRAARHRAPGAVPVGDHQLQPGARRGAERRGGRDHRAPSATSACRRR